MPETPAGATEPGARIDSIADRITALQQQTIEIIAQAGSAAERAREVRTARVGSCNHAEQVAALRVELDAVQDELDGLRVAMETRGVIEQAKGMLMLTQGCDDEAAFAMLVRLSQTSHRKLVDVARQVVESRMAADHAPA